MTQEKKDGKPESKASSGPQSAGATETVNRALASASVAASKATGLAGDVTDGLKPHAVSAFGALKGEARNLLRMGERHMIGLLFGLAGLLTLLAMASWLNYTLFFTLKYGGFLAHMDSNQLQMSNGVLARMGFALPSWRPFLGILIFTPLAATLTYTAALALHMAGDGRANSIDEAIAALRRNLRPLLLLGLPFALLAAIGTINFTVEMMIRQFEIQAGEVAAAEAPWRRVFDTFRIIMPPEITGGPIPAFPSPLGMVNTTFQRNVATWDWLVWLLQVPLFAWALMRISRGVSSLPYFAHNTEASWSNIVRQLKQGSLLKRLRSRSFGKLRLGSLLVYGVARILLWLNLVIFQFFGTGIFGWIMKLVLVLPISAASIAATTVVIVSVTRFMPPATQPTPTEN